MFDPQQSTYSHLHLPDLGRLPEADVLAVSVETVALKTWVTAALQCYNLGLFPKQHSGRTGAVYRNSPRLSTVTQKMLARDPLQVQFHCEPMPRASNPTDAAADFRQETETLCQCYCSFPSYAQVSSQAREHPEIRMGNGGATEDVHAAGRAKLSCEKEPVYKKKGMQFKKPRAATSHRNVFVSRTLDTNKLTSIERNSSY